MSQNADRMAKGAMRHLILWEVICLSLFALALTDRSFGLNWGFTPTAPYALALAALAGVPMHFAVRAVFRMWGDGRH